MAGHVNLWQGVDSQSLGLSFLSEIASEEHEEALHLGIKGLPGEGVLDRGDEMSELILHRLRRDTAGGCLEVKVRGTSDAMRGGGEGSHGWWVAEGVEVGGRGCQGRD